jgi:hypothetical protein
MKLLIEISVEQYESLLKYASDTSPLYSRLKNSVKSEANTIAVLCDQDRAEMLQKVAKHSCPEAVPQIEKAIRVAQVPT